MMLFCSSLDPTSVCAVLRPAVLLVAGLVHTALHGVPRGWIDLEGGPG